MKDCKKLRQFGLNLTKQRVNCRFTVSDLSRLSELSRGTIVNYERGRTTPMLFNVARIAEALNTSVDKLLENIVL